MSHVRGMGSKTVDTLCWTSLLSSGMTRTTHYLIWFAFSHLVKKQGFGTTWRSFWRKLCESLTILSVGVWPAQTMHGQPEARAGELLAGGFWGVVYIQRGDLEFMSKHFGLTSATSSSPCALCRCTNRGVAGEIKWTDVNWPPSWAEHCISDEVWERGRCEKVCGEVWRKKGTN